MPKLTHKPGPPKKSNNPRYYSTGAKLDIRTGIEPVRPDWWLPKEEYLKKRKQKAAIKLGVTPNAWQLSILQMLLDQGNKVAGGIQLWLEQHGVLTLSQVSYLTAAAESSNHSL